MKRILQSLGFVTVTFAVFGIALGILAFVSGSWAQSQLVTDAGSATDFGPVFIAVAYLQIAVVILFLGPIIAAFVGGLLSSILSSPKLAFLIGGGGSLIGFYLMSLIALGILVFSKGSNAGQAFSFGQVLVPMLIAGVPTALMGSLVSAVSSSIR